MKGKKDNKGGKEQKWMVIDMTIDEAIAHAREVAEEKYNEGFLCHANPDDGKLDKCVKCAQEHEQLAEWLTQLKEYQQLEEQGRLVILPCKYVYYIVDINNPKYAKVAKRFIKVLAIYDIESIDKENCKYFSTKEKAEERLKELRGEENEERS